MDLVGSLELRHVRTFLVLAEELNFTRTAERLGLTTSRVSQTVRQLEEVLGARLFDRTSRRVGLTALGESLRSDLSPAYAAVVEALRTAARQRTEVAGTLTVATHRAAVGGTPLPELVRAFEARHPSCTVQLVDMQASPEPSDWLASGRADVLLWRLPLAGTDLVVGPVLSLEPRVLLVADDHPLAGRAEIAYDELAGELVIDNPHFPRELMDDLIPPVTPSGSRLQRLEVDTYEEVWMLVATNRVVHPTVGSAFDPARAGVTAVPIRDLPPSRAALVWRSDRETPALRAFAEEAGGFAAPDLSAPGG